MVCFARFLPRVAKSDNVAAVSVRLVQVTSQGDCPIRIDEYCSYCSTLLFSDYMLKLLCAWGSPISVEIKFPIQSAKPPNLNYRITFFVKNLTPQKKQRENLTQGCTRMSIIGQRIWCVIR